MNSWTFRLNSFFRRNSVNIGIIIIILTLGTILFVEALAANQIQRQQKIDTTILSQVQTVITQLNQNSQQRTTQLTGLQNHIDCIVELFQQPNRADLTITDLQDCQIDRLPTTSNNSTSNNSASSTPPQSSNSGAKASQPTTSGGVSNKTQSTTPSKSPTPKPRGLDALPVVGGLFKKLGL
jgi:hypothetical protein